MSKAALTTAVVAITVLLGAGTPGPDRAGALAAPLVAQGVTPAAPAIPSTLRVGIARGSSYEVSTIPLETYVARVLAGEAAPGSEPAALQALAITVRTFALVNIGRHRADGFDLCDQTHCQVLRPSTPATERAAQATAGQVLLYRGALASVFYSASCGGHTERPSAVWPGADDPPYLPSRKDDACEGEPAWIDEISGRDLTRALAAAGFRGELRDLRVVDRDSSGRVTRLSLGGMTPSEISGQDLRTAVARTLGAQHVKSAAFDLRHSGDVYRFAGNGFGHGVGLCVMGSVKLAASGETAAAILSRYFPGTTISVPAVRTTRLPPAPVPPAAARAAAPALAAAAVVALPDGDQGDEAALVAFAVQAKSELARTLTLAAPARVTLRFHATVDEYERATGQPWFTSAAIIGQDIHFVPIASLRDRGILDRTIRRELVHEMVDGVLAERPAWVREGAALYYSDERASPERAQPRVSCPSDGELQQPLSAGALSDAYTRARACFARQVASGRSWRDVR